MVARRNTKSEPTIYTQESVAAARENADQYDWARAKRDEAVKDADTYLEEYGGLNGLWKTVTSQELPRSMSVSWKHRIGSPITGSQIYEEHGHYPWEVDPIDDPWTLTDPTTGMKFPTNDFGAYYESGLDEHHEFEPMRADESLLVNERYPERGETWGVDDGFGWEDDDGNVFTFVAYYNHWSLWRELVDAVAAFRDAYVFTGEMRYARAGTVLLDRIADVYPEMDISVWTDHDNIWNSHGTTGQGKIGGCIWETGLVKKLASAYDAFFPAQDDDELIDFLDEKGKRYDLGDKSSVGRVRSNIEEGILREVLPGVKNGQIRGNFGHHQAALAMAGVVLDDPGGYTSDAIDFLFRPGELVHEDDGSYWGEYTVTGGNVLAELVNVIDRDGHPNESPGYNSIMLSGIREIADILEEYDGYEGEELYENVKVERMHAARIPLVLLNRHMPHVGDTARTGDPGIEIDQDAMVDAFDRYEEPAYAQIAHLLAGGSTDELHGDALESEPELIADDIADVIDDEGPLNLPSTTQAGYGFTALRSGSDEDARAFWLTYGRNSAEAGGTSHNHLDTLNLGVMAYELNLAPDLGYPEMADRWPKRDQWTTKTISHNTVLVDEENQHPQWVSEPRAFDHTDRVQWIDLEAPQVYPQTDTYRRTTVGITVDDERSYAVDVFRIDGGGDHLFSFHGAEGGVETAGLHLTAQEGGSYAGPDVSKPDYGEDPPYNQEVGNGFNYLDSVEHDESPPEEFAVDWDITDTWDVREDDADVHLRMTMLEPVDDVALADGEPPNKPDNPETLRYLLCRRSGEDLSSRFTSVIEPYADERFVDSIDAVPVTVDEGDAVGARAVRVELTSGRTDYVTVTDDPEEVHVVGNSARVRGGLAVYSERAGEAAFGYLADGTLLEVDGETLIERDRGRIEGTIVDFARGLTRENEIVARVDGDPAVTDAIGDWMYVDTDGKRNGAYEIRGVRADGDVWTFELGDQTLVREYVEPEKPESGYVHNIEIGAPFTIPRSATWSATDR